MLLEEEMCHVIEYYKWHARWWDNHTPDREGSVDGQVMEGAKSYAAEQAYIKHQHATQLEEKWAAVGAQATIMHLQVFLDVSATQVSSIISPVEVEIVFSEDEDDN
ncbi:uncharacterized protein EDB91DRAFT_1085795 [Suillus paluster]|uniref:uncharacterized protein n=1 Tax=Suillus paluster TaxID=48578 RepID=UPI001B875FE8|nr:uncharacterized protein EDB91DRAFT_1085795 [Suillus paluster]KAG1729180.1 hypothetical protein EDB91DRAFT_1085795 [Suillus paluster]